MADERGRVSRQGLLVAEQAGRGGDRVLGHLTPGELVVPKSCQSPELMEAFAKAAHERGLNPNRFIVGSEEASRNPKTGLEEFLEGESGGVGDTGGGGASGSSSSGSSGSASPGSNSNGAGPMGGENAAHGQNQSSTAARDAAYGADGTTDGGGGFFSDPMGVLEGRLAVDGKNPGALGLGVGLLGGPVGLGVSYGREAAEAIGGMIDRGLASIGLDSTDKGFSGPGDPAGTTAGAGRLAPSTEIRLRARRGLLPSRRS
ncbi:hypothetical protein J2847_004141 [Azospirillum agricola]|uniref:hypothetical protein n=1 Tax=Azospirillum agricola TaxID=1720247 RepID=UPI001AE4A501|nr:hypothetical protein [Azospirillum agricola]MBP2230832.1 hypothetical protein [Azospirillum agricola]